MNTKSIKRKFNLTLFLFSLAVFLLLVFFLIYLSFLNVLPAKYFILLVMSMLMLYFFSMYLLVKKTFALRITSYFIFSIIFTVSLVGVYYTGVTYSFLKNSFNSVSSTIENKYVVLVKDNFSGIDDLKNGTIGYYKNIPNVDKANAELSKTVNYKGRAYSSVMGLFEDLDNDSISAVLIEETVLDAFKESLGVLNLDSYKKLFNFTVIINEDLAANSKGNVINIYLMGVDFTESNNDLNMLLTINKNTGKVLLTSIPRDYYIYFPTLGMEDDLVTTGQWGIDTPKQGVSNLFGIDIDYYIRVNTKSLVALVDELGGVEFCSDKEYMTTHVQAMTYYADQVHSAEKLYVPATCQTYNGIQILTISRERLAFDGGDRQRQKNCQQIIINILNKMASFDSIKNYTNVLDKLSDLYTTNIPDELITDIIKSYLNGKKYTYETQSVDGKGAWGMVVLGTKQGYMMIPDQASVDAAKAKIKEISK